MGHTSTPVSLGCGLAHARDLAGDTYNVITIIGGGSLSGGLAFEGLNNAAELDSNLIIIVNDNDQSIAENHGGLYRNLAELRASNGTCERNVFRARWDSTTAIWTPVTMCWPSSTRCRNCATSIIPSCCTSPLPRARALSQPKATPERWHHVGPFDMATGRKLCPAIRASLRRAPTPTLRARRSALPSSAIRRSWASRPPRPTSWAFTPELRAAAGKQVRRCRHCRGARRDFCHRACALRAPSQSLVYGTFLQRATTSCGTICASTMPPQPSLVFGAPIFGTTSETHLSFFDISMLGALPNMRYLAPACMEEYLSMLSWSLDHREHPVAIRVPGIGLVSRPDLAPAEDTDYSAVRYNVVRQGRDVAVLALGDFFELGERVANRLAAEYGIGGHARQPPALQLSLTASSLTVLPPSIALSSPSRTASWTAAGASAVACYLACTPLRTRTFGIAKRFPRPWRDSPNELLAQNGMTVENMAAEAVRLPQTALKKKTSPQRGQAPLWWFSLPPL